MSGRLSLTPGAVPGTETDAAPRRWHQPVTRWIARRSFPLLAAAVLIAIGMASSTWWGPHFDGTSHWQLPDDIRGTLLAARRLLHLDIGGLYTSPTGLVSFPGTAVVLVPVVALVDVLGLGLALPGRHNPHPGWWLAAGPYQIALSAIALLAVDAIAERSGASRPKRLLLVIGQAIALWNVSARWGHPEDAVAVALLLYGVLALSEGRTNRSAWLVGAAIAVQPLVLLAIPVIVVVLQPRRIAGYLAKAAIPAAALLGAALAANWAATLHAVVNQPNWPAIDHPTPWVALAAPMGHGSVAAGPARAVAVLLACGCAVAARRSWRTATSGTVVGPLDLTTSGTVVGPLDLTTSGTVPDLLDLLWWIALALSLRCVVESVMVAYYVWPVLALALASAVARWSRLVAATVFSSALTFLAQLSWHGRWGWWTMVLGGLLLVLATARGRRTPAAGDMAAGTTPPA